MATRIGVIKSISQGANVIATAKDGTQRVLKVGDEIFLGETIQTTDIDSKVVITANDGKDIAIIGKDTLNLDKSVAHNESFGDDSVADVSAIQKHFLMAQTSQILKRQQLVECSSWRCWRRWRKPRRGQLCEGGQLRKYQ